MTHVNYQLSTVIDVSKHDTLSNYNPMHMTHMIDVKYPLMNVTSDNLMHMTHDPCELAIITGHAWVAPAW